MRKYVFILVFLFASCFWLFAGGKTQEPEIKTLNNEWVLCITDFDVSSLPADRLGNVNLITRKLLESLKSIAFRTRNSEEYAYYEEIAWVQARTEAARSVAAKQNERSLLAYRGFSDWRYRGEIEKIDAEIEKLLLFLEETEKTPPLINRQPAFSLTRSNLDYSFPASPAAGSESAFCSGQKIDGFIAGSVSDFYGRFLLSIKFFALYAQDYVWEENIIFSHDDLDGALAEIARSLTLVLSGNQSSSFSLRVQPQDANVFINGSFFSGGLDSVDFPPGNISIAASAYGYEGISFNTNLSPGENADISVNLNKMEFADLEISGDASGSVYTGGLYRGEAPLTISLPLNKFEYIEMITFSGETGSIVYQAPDINDFSGTLFINTAVPPAQGIVEKARKQHYWAFGAAWLTGIAAWISYYNYTGSFSALSYSDPNKNMRNYYISMGTLIAFGAVLVLDIVLLTRYIITANRASVSVSTHGGN